MHFRAQFFIRAKGQILKASAQFVQRMQSRKGHACNGSLRSRGRRAFLSIPRLMISCGSSPRPTLIAEAGLASMTGASFPRPFGACWNVAKLPTKLWSELAYNGCLRANSLPTQTRVHGMEPCILLQDIGGRNSICQLETIDARLFVQHGRRTGKIGKTPEEFWSAII